jgi:hypothetical protein
VTPSYARALHGLALASKMTYLEPAKVARPGSAAAAAAGADQPDDRDVATALFEHATTNLDKTLRGRQANSFAAAVGSWLAEEQKEMQEAGSSA